jgi:hypothetical protein
MDEQKQSQGVGEVKPGGPSGRKLYHKPDFVFERAFETMALSCGKISRTQQQCKFNAKSS